ncbi:MAG TPA: copper chaperone PCu(A)C [Gammaproteobacteria bacterium]
MPSGCHCRVALAAVLLLASRFALAAGISVGEPWARASLGQAANGAAYLTLVNGGRQADRLLAVRAPVATRAELHNHRLDHGMLRMEQHPAIVVDAGATVTLAPGGLHVMLFGLLAPLQAGSRFPLVLVFEQAGEIEVSVPVLEATGAAPGGAHGHADKPRR